MSLYSREWWSEEYDRIQRYLGHPFVRGELLDPKEVHRNQEEEVLVKEMLSTVFPDKEERMSYRSKMTTHTILVGVAVVFALLAGASVTAWLLPTLFSSFGSTLVRLTGNPDIQLNVVRISSDPIYYTIVFGVIALGIRWLADRFW